MNSPCASRRWKPDEEPAIQPKPKRQESSLSILLMQAIHLAGARRDRLSRAERIRELTLLEVLGETMRRR